MPIKNLYHRIAESEHTSKTNEDPTTWNSLLLKRAVRMYSVQEVAHISEMTDVDEEHSGMQMMFRPGKHHLNFHFKQHRFWNLDLCNVK